MSILVSCLYFFVGVVNFAPIVGLLSAARLEGLYGLPFQDPNLIVLMRHRAVLFGIVGGILFFATFFPSARPVATVAGFASMTSFILLVLTTSEANAELTRVMWIDVVATVALVAAWALDPARIATG